MKSYKISDGMGANTSAYLSRSRHTRERLGMRIPRFRKTFARALKLTVQALKHLNEKYPRPKELEAFASPLTLRARKWGILIEPYPSRPTAIELF